MIDIDYSIFIQIALFLVIWFFLARFVFTPFQRLLGEREQRTEGMKAEAETLLEEAERLRMQYEERITKAKEEGSSIKEGIRQEALQAREQLLTHAQEDAARFLQTARQQIQEEMQRDRELAVQEAEVIGLEMAEKILARRVT